MTSNINDDTLQTIIKKRRGRPRKNQIIDSCKKHDRKNKLSSDIMDIFSKEDEEIVLHLPINLKEFNELKDKITIRTDTDVSSSSKQENTTFTITDLSYESHSEEESNVTNVKITELQTYIKKLENDIVEYKNILKDNMVSSVMENKVSKMDIDFICDINGKQIPVEKTDVVCWWDTEKFDTVPCFIPDRIVDGKFYVIGCFCSYNCAAAYNIYDPDMNDYNMWGRNSLIKKLYNKIYNKCDDIIPAPRRETLKKFGGILTIEEFRKNFKKCEKEYRVIMPPMKSLVPLIEESYRDKTKYNKIKIKDDDDLVLRRTKPLPNSKNTLLETFKMIENG